MGDIDVVQILVTSIKVVGEVCMYILLLTLSYIQLIYNLILPPARKNISNEVFLITGTSAGIGRQLILQLAKISPQTTYVLWDIDGEGNKKVAEEARKLGAKNVHTYQIDISDREKVEETAKKVMEEVGEVTMLYNNAGLAKINDFFKSSPADFELTFNVNVMSHFWILRAFLPPMIKRGKGHVITTVSAGAYFPFRYGVSYFSSKFAVNGYLEALKDELSAHPSKPDITFTNVYPSFVRTALTKNVVVNIKYQDEKQVFLTPEYVASCAIDGLLRNQHKVIIPKHFELLVLFKSILPYKFASKLQNHFMEGSYKEE